MESRVTPARAAAAVILFRSPMPAELAQLAGSEWVPEAAWQLDATSSPARCTITMRARSRIDADRVRTAPPGGRDHRRRIIRLQVPAETHARVKALLPSGASHSWRCLVETRKQLTMDQLRFGLGLLLVAAGLGGLLLILLLALLT